MNDDRAGFARFVEALDPYLQDLVVVGGWAQQLYSFHPLAQPVDFEPIRTHDVDVAAPLGTRVRGEGIAERLKAFGFVETFVGEERPPISEYRLGGDFGGFEIEFIAPQTGSGRRRGGEVDHTAIVAGVVVQKLAFVELLLFEPSIVVLGEEQGFPLAHPIAVRIANPACYVAQKLLALPNRRRGGRDAKDVLYVYDTILRFGDRLEELENLWRRCSGELSEQTKARLAAGVATLRGETRLARRAAEIAVETGRPAPPSPEELLDVCIEGVTTIFDLRDG